MKVSLKKGSVLNVPLFAGMSATSSNPAIATVKMNGTQAVVTAMAPGPVSLAIAVAPDLHVALDLEVTP